MKELFDILQHHASGTPSFFDVHIPTLSRFAPSCGVNYNHAVLRLRYPFNISTENFTFFQLFLARIYTFFQLFSAQISHFSDCFQLKFHIFPTVFSLNFTFFLKPPFLDKEKVCLTFYCQTDFGYVKRRSEYWLRSFDGYFSSVNRFIIHGN